MKYGSLVVNTKFLEIPSILFPPGSLFRIINVIPDNKVDLISLNTKFTIYNIDISDLSEIISENELFKCVLNKDELEVINDLIDNYTNLCSSGCYFEEMQKSKAGCEKCKFIKIINSLKDKFKNDKN